MAPKARTGSKKTLNAANLEALGADRLAAILLAMADEEPGLKRRLRMELASEVGAQDLAGEIEKRLIAIETSRARIHWRKYKGFTRDLALLRAMIAGPLGGLDPVIALQVMWRFLGLAGGIFQRADDSRGQLDLIFQAALADLRDLLARAGGEPDRTADRLIGLLEEDDHDVFRDLVATLAPVLTPASLQALRDRLEAVLQARRRPPGLILPALQQVADAQGDVDRYIATLTPAQTREPAGGAQIARRLLGAGRTEEALAALARSAPPIGGRVLVAGAYVWENVYLAALDQDGQGELAQSLRWGAFEARLSVERLREHLRRLPDFDEFDAEYRALAYARDFTDFNLALRFLTEWKSAANAAELVMRRRDAVDPREHELLVEAASLLESRHPLAATLLLRALVADTLRWAKTERYPEARRQLAELEALGVRVEDWQEAETAEAFGQRMARLRAI